MPHNRNNSTNAKYLAVLTLGALGVVYGDIGTSPLYALRECFFGPHAITVTPHHVLGVLSLIFWSLTIVISIDYLLFIMKADNHGEGGELALMALIPKRDPKSLSSKMIILLGLTGAALLYGDGMITPAISVLSAVEGLKIVTPLFEPYIVTIAVVVLCFLFLLQARGTSRIGAIFGPIILVWFGALAVLGIRGIMLDPSIFRAINPLYAINFLLDNGTQSLWVLGSVFLVVTGGEALYADMGHFGKRPIRIGWFTIAFPALVLNYLGQGALLLNDPSATVNPFYSLCPKWALIPMVILATVATVIASQAVIAGAFSLTRQAIQLGYFPRMEIRHTSSDEIGQIYVPLVNWILLGATIWLVTTFGSSSSLAAAYGLAVATTMVITTILIWFVAREVWKWPLLIPGIGWVGIFAIKVAFLTAAVIKIPHGGWFPLLIGLLTLVIMTTWWQGRRIMADRLSATAQPFKDFVKEISGRQIQSVPGVAIFMNKNPDATPQALIHNLTHNKVLHEKTVLMAVETEEVPHVPISKGLEVTSLAPGIYRVLVKCGFMDSPNVPRILDACKDHGLDIHIEDAAFFLGRETLIPTKRPGMALWRERIFAFMARNAQRATAFFKIPANKVIEIGLQVEL